MFWKICNPGPHNKPNKNKIIKFMIEINKLTSVKYSI